MTARDNMATNRVYTRRLNDLPFVMCACCYKLPSQRHILMGWCCDKTIDAATVCNLWVRSVFVNARIFGARYHSHLVGDLRAPLGKIIYAHKYSTSHGHFEELTRLNETNTE